MFIPYSNSYLRYILNSTVLDLGIESSTITLRRDNDDDEGTFNSTGGRLDLASINDFMGANSIYVKQIIDASGRGNNAIQLTKISQPRLGNAGTLEVMSNGQYGMYLDDSDDYMDIVDNDGLDITTGNLSILANFDPTGVQGYIISRNLDSSGNVQYGLLINTTYFFYLNGTQRADDADITLTQRILSGTYDHSKTILYKDGTLIESNNYSTNLVSSPNIQIGCRSNAIDGSTKALRFNGHINRILIHDKALSQTENTYLAKILEV